MLLKKRSNGRRDNVVRVYFVAETMQACRHPMQAFIYVETFTLV